MPTTNPNSQWDYQQQQLRILYTAEAITLGWAPEPRSMSNAVIAERSSHLAPLAVYYVVFEHASVFVVSWQALPELLYIFIFSFLTHFQLWDPKSYCKSLSCII